MINLRDHILEGVQLLLLLYVLLPLLTPILQITAYFRYFQITTVGFVGHFGEVSRLVGVVQPAGWRTYVVLPVRLRLSAIAQTLLPPVGRDIIIFS